MRDFPQMFPYRTIPWSFRVLQSVEATGMTAFIQAKMIPAEVEAAVQTSADCVKFFCSSASWQNVVR